MNGVGHLVRVRQYGLLHLAERNADTYLAIANRSWNSGDDS